MEDSQFSIQVIKSNNVAVFHTGPTDESKSLMELLVEENYDVLATCGGMALCATCCIDVIEGLNQLEEATDDEFAIIDSLPDPLPNSRLSCQIPLSGAINGLVIKLH